MSSRVSVAHEGREAGKDQEARQEKSEEERARAKRAGTKGTPGSGWVQQMSGNLRVCARVCLSFFPTR